MNQRPISTRATQSTSATDRDSFDAELLSTPGLAESYIQVAEDEYATQVKSGKIPPAKAGEVKLLLRQFRGEMTGVIVRRDLIQITKQMLRLKKKARLGPKDMELMEHIMAETARLQKLFKKVPKKQRQMLEPFLASVKFEAMLLCERRLVQLIGKADAKEMLAAAGMPSPSEVKKQVKRRRVQSRRPPGRKP